MEKDNENELIVNENEELEQTNETENTDTQTVEENVVEVENTEENQAKEERVFTQKELNEIVSRRVARAENRVKREYEDRYSKLDNTLSAALGTKTPEESAEKLAEYYRQEGIDIPERAQYNERDLQLLAKAEADSIINSGYEDLVDEVDRLARKGVNNMTQREKLVFKNLAEERQKQEQIRELASIGVKEDMLSNNDFKNFADKFDKSKVSMKEIYEMYDKTIPKKVVEPIGSMKSDKKDEPEYFTDEELKRLTTDDLKDDKIWKKARATMTRKNKI